MHHGKPRIALF